MTWTTLERDDRAVSIAVTHILTIGITTILITGLLVAGSGLLSAEKDRAARSELRTIGNRMAAEMVSAHSAVADSQSGSLTLRVSHPSQVAGSTYTVEIKDDCDGSALPNDPPCLVLQPTGGGEEVKVALDPDLDTGGFDLETTTVPGGELFIIISDHDGDPEIDITLSSDESPSLAAPGVMP